jgi:hypothetical protein
MTATDRIQYFSIATALLSIAWLISIGVFL